MSLLKLFRATRRKAQPTIPSVSNVEQSSTSVPMADEQGPMHKHQPRHKMFCFLRQKHNILTLLHRNSQDFQFKTPKIFNFPNPRSHLIFLQFSHFCEISVFSLIFAKYLLFLQYLAIIEVFLNISPLPLFITHNQQISQTKFSKVLRKILNSIYWMADKKGSRFLASPDLTFNKLTF